MMRPALGSLLVIAGLWLTADAAAQALQASAHRSFVEGLPSVSALRVEAATGMAVPSRPVVAQHVWDLFHKSYPANLSLAQVSREELDLYFADLITLGLATLNSGVGREVEAQVVALHASVINELDRRGMLTPGKLIEVEANLSLGREVTAMAELRGKYPGITRAKTNLDAMPLPRTPLPQNAVWRRSEDDGRWLPSAYNLEPGRIALVMQEGCRFAADALGDLSANDAPFLSRMDVILTPGSSFDFPALQVIAKSHPEMKVYVIHRNDQFSIGVDTRISPQFVHGATGAKIYGWPGYEAFRRWMSEQRRSLAE